MSVYALDPLRDARWGEFIDLQNQASVFHTPAWLQALRVTYGYDPVVFTTCTPNQRLTNGIAFCHVATWLTGARLVSLPFSDHCAPLISRDSDAREIGLFLAGRLKDEQLRYIEIRACDKAFGSIPNSGEGNSFSLHKLDLRPTKERLLLAMHKDSIKRKLQRAEREALTYERGRTPEMLKTFYALFVMTRKKHGLPPSPFQWFEHLCECFGRGFQIRIASKGCQPVAGIITLTYKKTIVYKYGGSDPQFNNLGGTPMLFWRTIEEAKDEGCEELDLGRSDNDNQGLITFKNRWGSTQSSLTYWRLPIRPPEVSPRTRSTRIAKRLLAGLPDRLRIGVGELLYRHLG